MLKRNEDLILYHGSHCEVETPPLARCEKYKDFGQGFYLTTSGEQAESFSLTSLRKAIANRIASKNQKSGVVSVFRCKAEDMAQLKICEFETANIQWLHCVVGHRKGRGFENIIEQYRLFDVIGGKIANDATNAAITAYMAGVYGEVGSLRASEFCIGLLLPERLKDQYCFRTQKALDALNFVESYQVWK